MFRFLFLFLFVTLSLLPLITCSDLLYSHRSRIKTQYTPKHSLRHAQHVMQQIDPSVTEAIGTQYNPFTGASLYYPSDVSLVYDIRDPYISAFYDMVETTWNNGTLLFLQHTTTATRPDEGAIRLFLGYPNQTRQEILNDYWTLNHPWYLGQDLAYDAQADPNSVVVTFEGIASPFNYRFMMLGFSLISLNETDGVHVRPHYMNESLANWVTRFRLPAGRTEPLYRTDGVITNPNWIMPASQQLILSQFTGVTSYVVKRITGTPTNPESGFLLLIRTMNFNAIRLIKYNNNMEIKFDTILVPTIQGTHSQADVPRPGSVVGHIDVDPDGHVYVLTDIMPYQRSIVTSYHNKFLAPEDGNTKPSILFLIDHDTGNIIRADWVPLHLAIPFDRAITTGLSVEAGEGQVALLFNGVKYPSEYGTLINFIDYDVENNYTSPPLAHSATINTYPQAIADACHQESRQTQAYAVTFLKDGRYAVGGSHGFGLTEDGQFFTPSMGFLAIFDLEELHVRGLTSKQVWNIGVVGRDNIVTHLAASPDGGLTFGMTLDGNAEDETNTTLQYYHSGVFKTVQNWGAKERCDAVTRMSIENATWTLTCGAESCISWCTSFVPNLSERPLPPYNLVASPLCATTVAPPTRPPTTQPPWIIPTDQPTASPTTIAPVPTDPPSSSASPATNAPVSSTGAGNGGGTAVTGSTKSSTGSSSSSFRPSSGSTAVDAAQGGTDQTSNTSPSSSSSRATALGVGLGIGLVGGLCLIIALVVLCMRRHKRAINTDMTTEGVPMHMGAGVRHQQLTNEI